METDSDIARFRQIVWPIALCQTLVWGAFYYIFAALLLDWERDLGWTKTQVSLAFSIAILTSAFLSPITGRLIDRGYGKALYLGSISFGACLLLLLSQVSTLWQFYTVWILMGMAVAGSLYEPTFAILTKAMDNQSKQAITQVTLAAGFASTICFPLSRILVNYFGWRGAVICWALIAFLVVLPAAWLGVREADLEASTDDRSPVSGIRKTPANRAPSETGNHTSDIAHPISPIALTQTPLFSLLAFGFAMIMLNHAGLLTHLLSIFDEKGVSEEVAVFAASLVGPAQVMGRIAMVAAGDRVSSLLVFSACYVTMALAAIILLGASFAPWLIFGFVILQGAGYGVTSIMRPVTTAELMGREHFGAVSGLLAIPFQMAGALAPTIAALLWGWGESYNLVIVFALIVTLLGLVAIRQAAVVSERRMPVTGP